MKILLIVEPYRIDFYSYLKEDIQNTYILLWHEKSSDDNVDNSQLPIAFEQIIYWANFKSPQQIIKKIQPDKIIFFEIIDLRQIALVACAKTNNITTFFIEHGAATDENAQKERWTEFSYNKQKIPYLISRFKNNFFNVIKSKIFYYSIFKGFTNFKSYYKFFTLPFKMLAGGEPQQVLANNYFTQRIPKYALLFNKNNFSSYALYTNATTKQVVYTGVPMFDEYFCTNIFVQNHIMYIDSPYLEEGMLQWTPAHHQKIATTLVALAKKNNVHIYIKLHPSSNIKIWQSYNLPNQNITLLQAGNFTNLYLSSKLILSFSSSLVIGFLCAKKNVVLLGWNPEPKIFGIDFSATELCHKSLTIETVNEDYDYWINNNLTTKNAIAYTNFLHAYNWPFDGKASQRIIDAINNYN